MKKSDLDHVLRSAKTIVKDDQFIIIGSQSLHGKHPDLPDQLMVSVEVDIIAKNHAERTEWLNVIGVDSDFHAKFGYYADPVDEKTAVLPKGWKSRLVNLKPGETDGARGLCLDPHDLAISKYVARREKDIVVTTELARRGIVDKKKLLSYLQTTPVASEARTRIEQYIERDFELAAETIGRPAKPPASRGRKPK